MTDAKIAEFVQAAEEIYDTRLRSILEHSHFDEFVAIEPESGNYFLGDTLNEASRAARETHPDRPAHVMRIGRRTALHFGMHDLRTHNR